MRTWLYYFVYPTDQAIFYVYWGAIIMNFDTLVGGKILELLKYWQDIGENPRYRLSIVKRGNPGFISATIIERSMLLFIKERVSTEQWNNIDIIFGEAEEYIRDKNRRMKRRREEEEREKIQLQLKIKEKNKKLKELEKILHSNFLGSRHIWDTKLSEWVSEDEFIKLSAQYIIKWFEKQGWPKPDQEQAVCIAEVWKHVLVRARAGSGKTSTIVNRATFLIKHCGVSPAEILLLAFNKKAAEEVNKRFKILLGDSKPQAMTFHALAHALVHPEEELIFDDETQGFSKSKTIQQVIYSYLQDPKWFEIIRDLMLEYFRADWEEIESGEHHVEPIKMVEYRRLIPYIGLDGKFYKSMGEKRLADFLFEYDIPYIYEQNHWWSGINYKPDFTIPLHNQKHKGVVIEYFGILRDTEYDRETHAKQIYWQNQSDYQFIELFPGQAESFEQLDQRIRILLHEYGVKMRRLSDLEIWHRIKDRAIDEFSMTVSQFIGLCRKGLISPEDLKGIIKNKLRLRLLSEPQVDFLGVAWKIYREYLEVLSINNEEDFDGLLIRAVESVKTGQGAWHRKAGSGDLKRIKYLFVDEYQDFSLLFYQLVSAIREINKDVKVFCVGDDWQAINGFAGSDLRFFKDFNNYFPDSKKLTISSNYRSYMKIIHTSNQLMSSEGPPSKSVLPDLGEVYVANIGEFKPDDIEAKNYGGDSITPALIRVVNSYIEKGQKVALLCRRGNGLPWFTPYSSSKRKFFAQFISKIREAFPEEQRSMVIAMDTVHSYKGKEEDTIIVVDAVERSYPLVHPKYVFFQVLGQTKDEIISEERRLFYVALSRAKKSLVIFTERGIESPFLINIQREMKLETIDINILPPPKRNETHYEVSICNKDTQSDGTYAIRSLLRENRYRWNPARKSWVKHLSAAEFSKQRLFNEPWIKKANNISVLVSDEFNNLILLIDIEEGIITDEKL